MWGKLLHHKLRHGVDLRLRLLKRYGREEEGPFLIDTPPGKRFLVLAPHPDDEVLGCGGTVAKLTVSGKPVDVLFLTGGERGASEGSRGDDLVRRRREEARAASRVLGIGDPEFWDLPDLGLSAEEGIIQRLAEVLETKRPDTVFCPSPFDRHPDHQAAFAILRSALGRREIGCWLYEVWSPLVTNYGVDISEVWPTKMEAMQEYRSQLEGVDYAEKILGLNAFRSLAYTGLRYVEAFLWLNSSEVKGWD